MERVTKASQKACALLAVPALLGCDIVQGFHIARPMPVEDVLRWLDVLRATPRALAS